MIYFFAFQAVCIAALFLILTDVSLDFAISRRVARRYRRIRNSTLEQGLPKIRNLDLRDMSAITEKWSIDLLTRIDHLMSELNAMGSVRFFSPDGKTEWNLSLVNARLYVTFRTNSRNSWQRLNPGWDTQYPESANNQARIIIGQILVGTRSSGFQLQHLNCGTYFSDAEVADTRRK